MNVLRRTAAVMGVALALTACASVAPRTVLREIQDASVSATTPLSRVAIVAIERDATARQAWESAFASGFAARGVATTTGEGLRGGAGSQPDAIVVDGGPVIAAARQAGADAILFVQPPNAVPVGPGHGAYRWFDARSAPDPRTDLDTTPASVTEVRLYSLRSNTGVWRAAVMRYYPVAGVADAGEIAASVTAGLAKRGYLR